MLSSKQVAVNLTGMKFKNMSHDTLTLHIYKNCKYQCLRGQGEIISLPCVVVWLEQTGAHFCIYLRVIIRAIVARLCGRRPARRSLCGSSGSRGGGGFIWWWRLESIQQKKTLLCIIRSGCCTNKLSTNAKLLYTSTKYSEQTPAAQVELPTVP